MESPTNLSSYRGAVPKIIAIAVFGLFIIAVSGVRNGLLFLVGLLMGMVFVHGRLGFTSGWRRLILHGNLSGFRGQMLMIVLSATIFIPLLAEFSSLSNAVAPIAWSGIIGAFIFGIGMQLGDGCGSGTLYKAGTGSEISQVALLFFIAGNFLATLHFHQFLSLGALPPVDLSVTFGTIPAVLIQAVIAIAVFGLALLWARSRKPATTESNSAKDFLWIGILALPVLALLNLLLSGQMWGIVYSFGVIGAKAVTLLGADLTNVPYWSQAVAKNSLEESIFNDITTLTNFGLILGAWLATTKFAGKSSGQSAHRSVSWKRRLAPVIGGLLLGYGSRLGFGCNIGAFLMGTASGSLHGWVWFVGAFAGSIIGVKLRRTFGYND